VLGRTVLGLSPNEFEEDIEGAWRGIGGHSFLHYERK